MSFMGFWDAAEHRPDHPAVIDETGTATTFGALRERADRLSLGLRSRGIGVGDTVAVLLPNSVDLLAVQLAALQIGAYFTPVNRHLTGAECGYVVANSGSRVLVAHEDYAGAAREAADVASLPEGDRFAVGTIEGFHSLRTLEDGFGGPVPDRTAGSVLLFSSGTTGRPKGIRRELPGLSPEEEFAAHGARFAAFGLESPDEVALGVAPLYHSAPNAMVTSALHLGQTVVLMERFDPRKSLELAANHGVTWSFLVPTMFHKWLALPEAERLSYDLSAFRVMVHSAAPCPMDTKRKMIDWVGPRLIEFYGTSECSMVTWISSEQWLEHPGSVGRAMPGLELRIMDVDGKDLPALEPGLIHVRGGASFTYRGDPAKTADSWQNGYYISGDVGYLDEDGWLFMCDRRTDLILSGGVNIYPAEIEGELLQHPAVADTVVIGVPDTEWGNTVVALVSLLAEGAATAEELEAHCRRTLAGFKVPRRFEFRDDLPRTASGKMSRQRVRDSYLAQEASAREAQQEL